jgi:hypothetical protein
MMPHPFSPLLLTTSNLDPSHDMETMRILLRWLASDAKYLADLLGL